MDLGWDGIEQTPSVYDFSHFDTLLSDLDSVNARALLIFDYSNPLYDQGLSPYTDKGRAAFAAYAAAAAKHFAGRNVIWEIYNEPNGGFWKPKANVDAYATLVKVTVDAIRRADPNAVILAGATSGLPTDYIEALLRSGAMSKVNALSVHPYRGENPETASDDYDHTRMLIARYTPKGQSPIPIICSEWGYSSVIGGVTEAKQAAYMVREYLANLANGVNLTIYYDWKNDGSDPANNEHRFGTLTQDLQPKPAYLAAADLIKNLRGYTFRHRLQADGNDDYRILFEGPNDLAIVQWSSRDNGDNPSLPVVQKVVPGDPAFDNLKQIASVHFAPNTLVASASSYLPIEFDITNPDRKPATVEISSGGGLSTAVVKPHETAWETVLLPVDLDGPSPQDVIPSIAWNGNTLTEIEPLKVIIGSDFDLAIAPRAADLSVVISNHLTNPSNGRVTLTPTGGRTASLPYLLAGGAQQVETFTNAASSGGKVVVIDNSGNSMARATVGRFVTMDNWPTSVTLSSGYKTVCLLNNAYSSSSPAAVTIADSTAPAKVTLAFPYQTGSTWRYYTLEPTEQLAIPDGAKALTIWLYGDSSGVMVRARYADDTGQVFQPDCGPVNWTGWRPVQIPLDGKNTSHWGGANDGVAHGKLHWSAVVLLDCGNMADHTGTVQLAAPEYAMR
jgi:hypothetical protein